MAIQAAEISAILREQIRNFGDGASVDRVQREGHSLGRWELGEHPSRLVSRNSAEIGFRRLEHLTDDVPFHPGGLPAS